MGDSVVIVDRLRRQLKKSARMEYASRERDRLSAEVELERTLETLRGIRSEPEHEVLFMTERFAWLDHVENDRRSQERSLLARNLAVEEQRKVLQRASQESRATELVLERSQAEEELERRRQEARALDAIAITRWRRR